MDIGCYPINTSRFLFDREPQRVVGLLENDPEMKVDRLISAILDFAPGQAIFTCSTQLVPYQRMQILGTKARIEIEIPYNAPPDQPCRIFVDDGSDLRGRSARIEEFPFATNTRCKAMSFRVLSARAQKCLFRWRTH